MVRRGRRRWVGVGVLALGGVALAVGWVVAVASRGGAREGRPLPECHLRTLDGQSVALRALAGRAATVLFFEGIDCPNSNKTLPHLAEIAQRYAPQGVAVLAINSNAGQDAGAIARHAREFGVAVPVLQDPGNLVADLAGVERTCEVLVLDARGVVRYHGALDDRFGRMSVRTGATHPYLADALDAVLAGQSVRVRTTEVVGCPIERARPTLRAERVRPADPSIVAALNRRDETEGPVAVGPVSFHADVAPILQRRCQACHRPGQEGPFSLLSFAEARTHASIVAEVVADRRMPPWHADPRFGHFRNDRSLTPRERATLLAWVEQGTPEGNPAQAPPALVFPDGWTIGTPDLVLPIAERNQVPAVGVLDYVLTLVPTHFSRDMWVEAAEVRPETRSVVHHIIVQILPAGGTVHDRGTHLATYVPGDAPTTYQAATAKRIPAGSVLKFGIHYVPDGQARTDRPQIGLVFSRSPVRHEAFTRSVEDTRFVIPPHAEAHPVGASFVADEDLQILSFAPHMHVRGKDFRYTATFPDGRSEILLSVPAYDFGWQSVYVLDPPQAIPRGTRIECLAHFDNSARNPANPDPSATVRYGEQSFEEMMLGYFDYVRADHSP